MHFIRCTWKQSSNTHQVNIFLYRISRILHLYGHLDWASEKQPKWMAVEVGERECECGIPRSPYEHVYNTYYTVSSFVHVRCVCVCVWNIIKCLYTYADIRIAMVLIVGLYIVHCSRCHSYIFGSNYNLALFQRSLLFLCIHFKRIHILQCYAQCTDRMTVLLATHIVLNCWIVALHFFMSQSKREKQRENLRSHQLASMLFFLEICHFWHKPSFETWQSFCW